MKVSITYLRGHLSEVLWALEHNEDVCILRRGRWKGIIKTVRHEPRIDVRDHPFFNMSARCETVDRQMNRLRRGRYCDL
jgi:hypothetical protein